MPIYDVLSEEGLEIIEYNADTILEEIGIEFRDDAEALELWKDAGADVTGVRVRMPRGLAQRAVKNCSINIHTSSTKPGALCANWGQEYCFCTCLWTTICS